MQAFCETFLGTMKRPRAATASQRARQLTRRRGTRSVRWEDVDFLISILLLGTLTLTWRVVSKWLRQKHFVVRHLAGGAGGFVCMFAVAMIFSAFGLLKTKPEKSLQTDTVPTKPIQLPPLSPHEPVKTAVVANPPLPPPAEPTPSEPVFTRSMGSIAAFRAWFERLELSFKSAPLADGTPRSIGISADKMTTVEIIGHGDRLEKATMMFGLDKNNVSALAVTTGALIVFTRELGWPDGQTWVIKQIQKGTGETQKNGVLYRLTVLKELGIMTLVAEPVPKK